MNEHVTNWKDLPPSVVGVIMSFGPGITDDVDGIGSVCFKVTKEQVDAFFPYDIEASLEHEGFSFVFYRRDTSNIESLNKDVDMDLTVKWYD